MSRSAISTKSRATPAVLGDVPRVDEAAAVELRKTVVDRRRSASSALSDRCISGGDLMSGAG